MVWILRKRGVGMSFDLRNEKQSENQNQYLFEQRMRMALPEIHASTPSGRLNGAVLAVSSIQNAIPIIHGSAGCGFHYRYLCRKQKSPVHHLQCTNLTEMELILGGEQRLKDTILQTYKTYHPSLIAVILAVSAEIIQSNIEGVIREIESLIDCKVIAISASGISHADKRYLSRKKSSKLESEFGKIHGHDAKMKGCGFSDAMTAFVNHIMKSQTVTEKSINLCGIAWGIGEDLVSYGIIRELEDMGCTINARLPACCLDEMELAPRAQLNLLTYRVRWAVEMEKKFNTPFFAADPRIYGARGISGILDFYMTIAHILNLNNDTKKLLMKKAKESSLAIADCTRTLNKSNVVLCCDNYRNLKNIMNFYCGTLNFNVKSILLKINGDGYFSMISEAERFSEAETKINEVMVERNLAINYYINPENKIIMQEMKNAKYIVGSDCFMEFAKQGIYLEMPEIFPLNFTDYQSMIMNYLKRINWAKSTSQAFHKQLSYKLQKYRKDDDNEINRQASNRMWEHLWLKRGSDKHVS